MEAIIIASWQATLFLLCLNLVSHLTKDLVATCLGYKCVVCRCHSQDDLSKLDVGVPLSEGNLDFTPLSESHTSCNAASSVSGCSLLVDTVLSFIKAFRLKANNTCLRRVVGERFSSEAVELAKNTLWNTC